MAIDVGLRNPPADGPSNASAVPYPIWCTADNSAAPLGIPRKTHGQGAGCIEMRYLGVYMDWCSQAFDSAWAAYYGVT